MVEQGRATVQQRAAGAERAVRGRFGGRMVGLPWTHLARVVAPSDDDVAAFVVPGRGAWHYWWQAHYLDCLVDAGERLLRDGDQSGARERARLGHVVVLTLRLRNGLRFTNHFYDDLGWLTLALGRLATLDERLGRGYARASLRPLERWLAGQLSGGLRPAGGVFWNKERSYVNSATTAPVALAAARAGHRELARWLLDWLMATLIDATTGLVIDGVRVGERGEEPAASVFTYNQGTTLALLLELGEFNAAGALVRAVADNLTRVVGSQPLLQTHGGGDGGLFSGILVRHLEAAAHHPALDEQVRALARNMVQETADGFWFGRRAEAGVFSSDPAVPAVHSCPAGGTVELSTQLTAWMTLEAAARLEGADP